MSAAPPIRITDRDAPEIALFREVRERDLVGREGVFIAEGLSVLNVLLRSSLSVRAILVEEGRLSRLPVLEARGATPLYVAPQDVLDAIAGFHLHRGILAAAEVPASADLAVLPETGPLRLPVLVTLANHDNVGGIYRNAAAFGAAAVAIDARTADPFYRKAIRVGVGAPLIVPTIRTESAEALLPVLAARDITPYALTPRATRFVGEAPLAPRAAFFLGTEGEGLPDALIDAAEPLAIRIAPGFDSLNVAAASAVALHAHAIAHRA
ncbi:TrmH family RNA methyltransferase [Acuticoccus kandeliae]|uniref:TrmH family RNA methyltransferase n=1 Tax=Acuticoccus kandeliae TaxID=2073160 RepID=UPI000D3E89F7|nr:TrmH family RNA methyltransferase [Acuticoccus kandeliae]